MTRHSAACALLLALFAAPVQAAPPIESRGSRGRDRHAGLVEVFPLNVSLTGARDSEQLVVTGKYADGTLRDLSAVVTARVEPADVVEVQDASFFAPRRTVPQRSSSDRRQGNPRARNRRRDGSAFSRQLSPRGDRLDERRRLQRRGLPRHAQRQETASSSRSAASTRPPITSNSPRQFGRRTDKHDPKASLMLLKAIGGVPTKAASASGSPACRAR